VVFEGFSRDSEGKDGADIFLYSNGELRSLINNGAPSPVGGTFYFLQGVTLPQVNSNGEVLFGSSVLNSTNFGFTDGLFLITRDGIKKKVQPVKGNAAQTLSPPNEGKDWGLVIDDAARRFAPPGRQ
jgi:hypothetical protein